MSFEEATNRMCAAIAAEDFDALDAALLARAQALSTSPPPALESIQAGERALLDLAKIGRAHV